MKQLSLSCVTLGLFLCATSIAISAEIRYRITPIIGDPPTVSLGPQRTNNKAELVGSFGVEALAGERLTTRWSECGREKVPASTNHQRVP